MDLALAPVFDSDPESDAADSETEPDVQLQVENGTGEDLERKVASDVENDAEKTESVPHLDLENGSADLDSDANSKVKSATAKSTTVSDSKPESERAKSGKDANCNVKDDCTNSNTDSDSQPESDTEEPEASDSSNLKVADMTKAVFQIFGELELDGKKEKFVAFQGNLGDWDKLQRKAKELKAGGPADTADQQKVDVVGSDEESMSDFPFFSAERMIDLIKSSVEDNFDLDSGYSSKVKMWNSGESIEAISLLHAVFSCSQLEAGELTDCAFQYCESLIEWVEIVNSYAMSLPEKELIPCLPCLFLDVTKTETLEEDDPSLENVLNVRLTVELTPLTTRYIAFEGTLGKWTRFLNEFEKQLTRVMKDLKGKDQDCLTSSEKWRLAVYDRWGQFLDGFCDFFLIMKVLALFWGDDEEVPLWYYQSFLKSCGLLFCALPWHWEGHRNVADLDDFSTVVEMLEVLQMWLVLLLLDHPGGFEKLDVFLEVIEVPE